MLKGFSRQAVASAAHGRSRSGGYTVSNDHAGPRRPRRARRPDGRGCAVLALSGGLIFGCSAAVTDCSTGSGCRKGSEVRRVATVHLL